MAQLGPSALEHYDPCDLGEIEATDNDYDYVRRTLEAGAVRFYISQELDSPSGYAATKPNLHDPVVAKRHEAARGCAHMIVSRQCSLLRYKREPDGTINILPKLQLVDN